MSEMCYEEIKELISRLLNNKENAIAVGIDGRCASGKTKLSEKLKKEFNASVIHMDDFFLPTQSRRPPSQRPWKARRDLPEQRV